MVTLPLPRDLYDDATVARPAAAQQTDFYIGFALTGEGFERVIAAQVSFRSEDKC